MTGLIIKFLLENWKAVAISILIAVLMYVVNDYTTLRERIKGKEEIIKQYEDKYKTLKKISDNQQEKLDKADNERIKIMEKMNNDINKLLKQQPPKECKDAIDWAIKNKGDIQWPK